MSRTAEIAVVGTGAWGTTLAGLLARAGRPVALCTRTPQEAHDLQMAGENRLRLPGVPLPTELTISAEWEEILPTAATILLVVPAQRVRENAKRLRSLLRPETIVASASKGLEMDTLLRMSQVLSEELPEHPPTRIATLSGPNLSREINQAKPAATVAAALDLETAQTLQEALMTPLFRVYTSTDQIGVELGGALKNVIALAAGLADGLKVGDNAKAALITRGLAEMVRLGVAMGARPITFAGLAGLGDLVATCSSPLSRNHYVGAQLALGRTLKEILSTMHHVAEGVWTTRAACTLARQHGVEMPIAEEMYGVLFEENDPQQTVLNLMERPGREEWAQLR